VPEHLLGRRVPEYYALSSGVRDDDRIPDPFEEFAESQLLRTLPLARPYAGSRFRVRSGMKTRGWCPRFALSPLEHI